MTSATRTLTAVFGTLTALAAAEHGMGEILQGSTRPTALVIQSWPDSPFFRIENGEPAMTIIPNLLAAGIATVLLSAAYLVTALVAADRPHSGSVLVGLAALLLLTGGGFGPPLLGVVVGITATRIAHPVRMSTGLGRRLRSPLASSWRWWLAAALASWLLLLPGLPILDVTLKVDDPMAVVYTFGAASVLLALAIWSALAHDTQLTIGSQGEVVKRQPASGESRVLVAYASRYGSTEDVAKAIGTALRDDGARVDVKPAGDVHDLAGYDAAVVGGPIYVGSLLRDEKRFLERHERALREMPVAVFALGPIQASDDSAKDSGQLARALTAYPWLDPIEARVFVGRYDPQKLRLTDRLVTLPPASPLRGVGAHDDRDWGAIHSWAKTLVVALRPRPGAPVREITGTPSCSVAPPRSASGSAVGGSAR